MGTLYIIGNGFDSAHGLKTSYWHFRAYLEKYASDFLTQMERLYDIAPHEKTDGRYKENRQIQKLIKDDIGEKLWKDFEYLLGEADEAEMLAYSETTVADMDMESGSVGIKDTLDAYWEEQYAFIRKLNEYVYRWIRQIRLNKAVPQKTCFLNNTTDYFFTFNYTNVLECIYHIPVDHILHIHGGLMPYCDEAPILGHGNRGKIEAYTKRAKEAGNAFLEGEESINLAIANYYKRTWKDTNRSMFLHSEFFQKLNGIDRVEIIGQSYGRVDLPYLEYIKKSVSENAHWIFYFHASESEAAAREAVQRLKLAKKNVEILHSSKFWS